MKHRIAVGEPLDMVRTLSAAALWGGTSWQRIDDTGAWYAERTPQGPATVRLRQSGDHVDIEAWGDGAATLVERVPDLVGDNDAVEAFQPGTNPVIRELAKRNRGVRLSRTHTLFPRLVSTILGQRITGKESKNQLRTLAWRWGERAPGPRDDLWLLPTPERLASTPYYAFHPLGIERQRAGTIIRAARHASWLERSLTMSYEVAHRRLQHIPGIGPWTSGAVVGLVMADPDSLPIGDYHLPSMVSWTLAGEARADDVRMLQLLEPWAGQRGRVARMIKGKGTKPPKFGPRVEIFDIRDA